MHARLPILSFAAAEPAPLAAPTVAALEALWQTWSQRRLWAAPTVWRYLRLRRHMRLRLLDPKDVGIVGPTPPMAKVNDCHSCTDICCVGPKSTVLLRLRDIAMLRDLGRTDLISQHKPSFATGELASAPMLRRQVGSQAWQIFPVLKKDSMHACAALSREGKCTLYPHWPMSCARFPYALHVDEADVFYSQRCQSFWLHPEGQPQVQTMAASAVACYNERIKDAILLTFARPALEQLGLTDHLALPPKS